MADDLTTQIEQDLAAYEAEQRKEALKNAAVQDEQLFDIAEKRAIEKGWKGLGGMTNPQYRKWIYDQCGFDPGV